jgi:hypothetical protein
VFAVARHRLSQWRSPAGDDVDDVEDEFPQQEARQAAREWSRRAGEPDAEGLITEKLRVGWQAQQRRARRTRR